MQGRLKRISPLGPSRPPGRVNATVATPDRSYAVGDRRSGAGVVVPFGVGNHHQP
jgi:hypothetical protein